VVLKVILLHIHIMSVLEAYKSATKMHSTDLEPYKVEFIEAAMDKNVLLFGEFTLKSGRSVALAHEHARRRW
jgi:hypothetical protein